MILARGIVVVALMFLSGCVTQNRPISLHLGPVWTAMLFAEGTAPSDYLDEAARQWLHAATVYIYEKHAPPASNDELDRYLQERFEGRVRLPQPWPQQAASGEFLVPLKQGGTFSVRLTSTRLEINTDDPEFHSALIASMGLSPAKQGSAPAASDFGLAAGLLRAFKLK